MKPGNLAAWSCIALLVPILIHGAEAGPAQGVAGRGGKTNFTVPAWHPDARWELCRLGGCNGGGFLDGPTRALQSSSIGVFGPGYINAEGGRFFFGWFDPANGLAYAAAGSGRGYLDGPISRARFSGWDYNGGPFTVQSPDARFLFLTDRRLGKMTLRCIDWAKQTVRTIVPELPPFLGMTAGPGGSIYMLSANGQLRVLNAEGQPVKEYTLATSNAVTVGFLRNYPLAVDDVHNRLYCAAPPSKGWYLGYWDLADGTYHGVVPKSEKRRTRNQPGPFEGVDWYDEGNIIQFGPDDPERRFLYMVRTDTWQAFRLDLERKMVAALLVEGNGRDGKPQTVSFNEAQGTGTAMIYGTMRWLADGSGSFTATTHSPSEAWLYRRIK
jgi:hypothetical protein